MTILEAIKEIKAQIPGIKRLIYADLNEANFLVDALKDSELPLMVVLPYQVSDTIALSGALKTTFPFEAWLITKADLPTTDYKSNEIEKIIIEPMRLLGRQFMHKFTHHEIIDKETDGITQVTYDPLYAEFDASLFGVRIRSNIPVMEKANVCLP